MGAIQVVKGSYTGIAAPAIDGKTLHFIAMIPLNGAKQSAWTITALELYWHDKHYLINDKISMVSRKMFAKLSNIIRRARAGQLFSSEEPFGGLNSLYSSATRHAECCEEDLKTLHGLILADP